VNHDDGSVTVSDVENDVNQKRAKILVGAESRFTQAGEERRTHYLLNMCLLREENPAYAKESAPR
jgi:hypothetical protein